MPPDVVNGQDVRVVQRRGCPGFLFEASEALRIGGKRGWQNFDRDRSAEA
jgi:hypothetical protein